MSPFVEPSGTTKPWRSNAISSAAVGLSAIPQGANHALIEVEDQPIRWFANGTPTADIGHNGEIGDTIELGPSSLLIAT